MNESPFKWHGLRPADNGELESFVRASMRFDGVNMKKPKRLVISTIMLTDDWNGPSVSVWGKRGSKKFHAEYSPKTVWQTLADLGGAA